MKKLNEIQGNSERQSKELRNKINDQEYFTKETETVKNHTLELKNWLNEVENALGSTGNRADSTEEN